METLNPDLESAQRVYICSEDTSSIHFLARCVRLARLGGKPNSPSLERGCGTARRQRTQGGPPLASVPGAHFRAWRLQCATESAPGRRAARALTWGARAPGAPSLRRIWARSVRGAASSRGAKGSSLASLFGSCVVLFWAAPSPPPLPAPACCCGCQRELKSGSERRGRWTSAAGRGVGEERAEAGSVGARLAAAALRACWGLSAPPLGRSGRWALCCDVRGMGTARRGGARRDACPPAFSFDSGQAARLLFLVPCASRAAASWSAPGWGATFCT